MDEWTVTYLDFNIKDFSPQINGESQQGDATCCFIDAKITIVTWRDKQQTDLWALRCVSKSSSLSEMLTILKGITDWIWVSHVTIFGYHSKYFRSLREEIIRKALLLNQY